MEFQSLLATWRTDRGILSPQPNYPLYILEEVQEYEDAITTEEQVDALCDILVFTENQASLECIELDYLLTYDHPVDIASIRNYLHDYTFGADNSGALQLITYVATTALQRLGYSLELSMLETIREISSRTGAIDPTTGKWQKYTAPAAKALWYSADYSKCKV